MKIGTQIQFPCKKWRETKKGKNKIKNNLIKIWENNIHPRTGPTCTQKSTSGKSFSRNKTGNTRKIFLYFYFLHFENTFQELITNLSFMLKSQNNSSTNEYPLKMSFVWKCSHSYFTSRLFDQ